MPSRAPFDRLNVVRMQIVSTVPAGVLGTPTPTINQDSSVETLLLSTEGPRIVKANTPPCGIVFSDKSFLTLFEEWSISTGELLQYSYHYQQRGLHVRFDMVKKERRKVPKHHLNTSTLLNKHVPCGGPVGVDAVLEMIVEQFLPRNP